MHSPKLPSSPIGPDETDIALHDALQELLQTSKSIDGQLGSINLAVRYDSRVGKHIHASATVRHRLFVTKHVGKQETI